ncbi:MAG: ribosomal protein S18-alanine N-acetyltransferase [Firmicutes bacterium]|nr:ribosomal protein S18-alanine N-acetyltransferase [Bacillota bacterium]
MAEYQGENISIRISDGRKSDIDALAELEKLCFPVPWSWESIARSITESKNSRFYLAETEGKIVACVSCWLLPPYECQLGNVAVHPEYRRRGIATLLLKAMLADCEALGIMDTTLEVRESNKAARALYEGLGFESEGIRKGYYQGREDAVIMWRRERLRTRS